jgi:hypothetical protein
MSPFDRTTTAPFGTSIALALASPEVPVFHPKTPDFKESSPTPAEHRQEMTKTARVRGKGG